MSSKTTCASAVYKLEMNQNQNQNECYSFHLKDFLVAMEAVVLEAASATIVNTIWVKHPTAANRLKVDCRTKL
jgi:hypothetical protein